MQAFRKLAKNIFFKIFLGFIALTFILFGIGDFIFSGNKNIVAKIGDQKIHYNSFISYLERERRILRASYGGQIDQKYLASEQFQREILNQLILSKIIDRIASSFKIHPGDDLAARSITSNASFQDQSGKFNKTIFHNYLQTAGFRNEKTYFSHTKDSIKRNLLINPLITTQPLNAAYLAQAQSHRSQTRKADIITVLPKNIRIASLKPTNFELEEFFNQNKGLFALPKMHQISYLTIDPDIITKNIRISESQARQYYQNNQQSYITEESRNFLHILLSSRKEAQKIQNALNKLSKNTDNKIISKQQFLTIIKDTIGKDESQITITNVTKNNLPQPLQNAGFSLKDGQYSETLESDLGFHIFYLLKTNPAQNIAFAKVKQQIISALAEEKREQAINDLLARINDEILISESLAAIAKKTALPLSTTPYLTSQGADEQGNIIRISSQILTAALKMQEGEISNLIFSEKDNSYYLVSLDKITNPRQKSIDEVRGKLIDLWQKQKIQERLQILASDIAQKLQSGVSPYALIKRHRLKIKRNQQFTRIDKAQTIKGEIFKNAIFQLKKPRQVTNAYITTDGSYRIAILKSSGTINKDRQQELQKQLHSELRIEYINDILLQYNKYISALVPVSTYQNSQIKK